MNGQEMMHRETKQATQEQETEQRPMEQERKYHSGGGGGPVGFFAFGGSSKSSSTVCRPDPNNPGHQICKKVITETRIDPRTGQKITKTSESEDSTPLRTFGSRFFNGNNAIQPAPQTANTQPSDAYGNEEKPGFFSKIKNFFTRDREKNDVESPGSGFIQSGQQNVYPAPSRVPETHQHQQNLYRPRDSYDEIPSLNPFRIMREFERMFEEDFDITSDRETGAFGRNRDEGGVFDEFFGHSRFMRPSSYSHSRDSDDDFGGFFHNGHSFFSSPHIGPVAFYINDQNNKMIKENQPNNRSNFDYDSQPSQETEVEEPSVETAAGRAKAKIYDV